MKDRGFLSSQNLKKGIVMISNIDDSWSPQEEIEKKLGVIHASMMAFFQEIGLLHSPDQSEEVPEDFLESTRRQVIDDRFIVAIKPPPHMESDSKLVCIDVSSDGRILAKLTVLDDRVTMSVVIDGSLKHFKEFNCEELMVDFTVKGNTFPFFKKWGDLNSLIDLALANLVTLYPTLNESDDDEL